ncbi:GAF domain-containing sensor histidine kinase, partial [Petrachloros mirabilis]
KDHVYEQFGPYRKSCAYHVCQSSKAALAAFPYLIYGLKPATIVDRRCIVEGDEYCEWEFTWVPKEPRVLTGSIAGIITSGATLALLIANYPTISWLEAAGISVFPGAAIWFANAARVLRKKLTARDRIIQEQIAFVDIRHEELREAYLVQQQAAVDLKRRIGQLTLLYQTGIIVSSTLDRETLINTALTTIRHNLHFDRVMLSFYDQDNKVSYDARLVGVPDEIATFARSLNTPVTDPSSIEGQLLLEGTPILIKDIRKVWDRLHPLSQQLASVTHARSIIVVPLKVQNRIIGSLTVDRLQDNALNEEDLDVMVTVANQLAIALQHAAAYQEIEELNLGLERKVHERTAQLEAANEQLQELNQLKSNFVSVVSHELRTPMTSIKAYLDNMLDGMTGPLNEKQCQYLSRMRINIDRLTRMIIDLLDLTKIESGRVEMRMQPISIAEFINETIESIRPLTAEKSILLEAQVPTVLPRIQGDRDKLAQILTNLIGNATKFTPAGGTILVKTEVSEASNMLQICVSDTGCGIPQDELPKVFEKFFRGSATPEGTKGAGLGLAIVKSLVELHGGQVWVESTQRKGSSFFFAIPSSHHQ